MAERRLYRFDESRFKPGQKAAAVMMVEREFLPKGERKTTQEVADEIGISRKALYNWDKKDDNFIEYKRYLSSQILDSHVAMVHAKLIETIDKHGSIKAIELFMKRAGELADKQDITINDGSAPQDFEDRQAAILARLGESMDEEGEEGEVENKDKAEGKEEEEEA